MRVLRKQVRKAILASVASAAMACSGSTTPAANDAGGRLPCPTSATLHVIGPPSPYGFADGGNIPNATTTPADAGMVCLNACTPATPPPISCSATVASPFPDGGEAWDYDCTYQPMCTGRRPEGLACVEPGRDLGAHFARLAHLEAASVPAFRRLARELEAHGAPASLVNAARRAAREEIRHARVMGRLARKHGAPIPRVEHARFEPRSLEALALENAVEGCVREAFGAAIALHEARSASHPELRVAMGEIATDELGHAELAFQIDAWARSQLTAEAARRLDRARARAVAELADGAPAHRHLHAELARTLWA